MFYKRNSRKKVNKRLTDKRRSFIYQDMFGSFVDPTDYPENLFFLWYWDTKGVFFSRLFSSLIILTIIFLSFSSVSGIFLFLVLAQWFVYYFDLQAEIEHFTLTLDNGDWVNTYTKKMIRDEDIWSFWSMDTKPFLARGHIIFDVHYSIVDLMNKKLHQYKQKFRFFFLTNYEFSLVNFSSILKKKKKTIKENFKEISNFDFINKSSSKLLNIFKFSSYYQKNFFFKDFFVFRNKHFNKFLVNFFNIKLWLKIFFNLNFKKIFLNRINSKAMIPSWIEYNQFILNSYNLKSRTVKLLTKSAIIKIKRVN